MSFRHTLNSLSARIILMGCAVLLLAAVGRTWLLSDYLRHDVRELAAGQLMAIARYVAQDVDRDIVLRRELLQRVASRVKQPELLPAAELVRRLEDSQQINPLFSQGMFILDRTGRVLADTAANRALHTQRSSRNYHDRDYFQLALQGQSAIGRPTVGRSSKMPVLPMAEPLRDAQGRVVGVLVGVSALQSPNFLEALYTTQIGESGGLLLISPQHQLFVGSSDPAMILQPTPPPGVNQLHDRAMRGEYAVDVTVNARGVEELSATVPVPASGWFVVARLPTQEAFMPVTRLRDLVIRNTALVLPLFMLLTIFAMRRLMRPLMTAAQHAEQMTQGEMPLQALPVVRNDEVGHLTAAFNGVLEKLLESRAALTHLAHHDALTGLPNRQLLADRLQQALARAQRQPRQLAVLFLDLDGFKAINDRLGHEAGDQALQIVAQRLAAVIRQEDTLARVGGDEFVILLADLAAISGVIGENLAVAAVDRVAAQCLAVFTESFIVHGEACQLGVSIGVCLGSPSSTADALLVAADRAMYQAKAQGRGQVCWAAP